MGSDILHVSETARNIGSWGGFEIYNVDGERGGINQSPARRKLGLLKRSRILVCI